MQSPVPAVLVISVIALLLTAGCADIKSTRKVGDFGTIFGTSPEERQAIGLFSEKYGDPQTNNNDPPRFVIPLVTSGLRDSNLPADNITTFPVDSDLVYFFVIYDNFREGDPITVNWTSIDTGDVMSTVQQQAGGDFGRLIIGFRRPDSGWRNGLQRITVSGNGATADVDFFIGDIPPTTLLPDNTLTGQGNNTTPLFQGIPINESESSPGLFRYPESTTNVPVTMTTIISMTTGSTEHTILPACGEKGKTRCSGTCTNLMTDGENCGSCGHSCLLKQQCVNGQCKATAEQPQSLADLCHTQKKAVCNGSCVDMLTDSLNCGSCNTICPAPPNTKSICNGGVCTWRCNAPYDYPNGQGHYWGNCDQNSVNGCETDLDGNVKHCGSCNMVCPAPPNTFSSCIVGVCTLRCNTTSDYPDGQGHNWGNCDQNIYTGCESDLGGNNNCGSCGHICSANQQCVNRQCNTTVPETIIILPVVSTTTPVVLGPN